MLEQLDRNAAVVALLRMRGVLVESRLLGTKPVVLKKSLEEGAEEEGDIVCEVGEEDNFCFLLGGENRGETGSVFRDPLHNSA